MKLPLSAVAIATVATLHLCAQTAAPASAPSNVPQAQITNGLVKATLYLPDAKTGYYRGTRFDWSGQIPSLEYKGHSYFGNWNERPYSPTLHDAIMGPVEEFSGDLAVGYEAAPVGGTFLKIGVGLLRKPQEAKYDHFKAYELVDPGKWTTKTSPDSVTFTHVVHDKVSGYAYEYQKVVRLAKGKPTLEIEHRLKNTGKNTIQTDVYEHNFYMLDKQPTGPDIVVRFPFEVKAAKPWQQGLAETRGKEVVYLKELEPRQTASNDLTGYTVDPKDYDITVENKSTGVGVRQTGDRPISRINYWSIRTTACPEAYVDMSILPGKDFTWKIKWDFYAPK
jgi:hypothetical protein